MSPNFIYPFCCSRPTQSRTWLGHAKISRRRSWCRLCRWCSASRPDWGILLNLCLIFHWECWPPLRDGSRSPRKCDRCSCSRLTDGRGLPMSPGMKGRRLILTLWWRQVRRGRVGTWTLPFRCCSPSWCIFIEKLSLTGDTSTLIVAQSRRSWPCIARLHEPKRLLPVRARMFWPAVRGGSVWRRGGYQRRRLLSWNWATLWAISKNIATDTWTRRRLFAWRIYSSFTLVLWHTMADCVNAIWKDDAWGCIRWDFAEFSEEAGIWGMLWFFTRFVGKNWRFFDCRVRSRCMIVFRGRGVKANWGIGSLPPLWFLIFHLPDKIFEQCLTPEGLSGHLLLPSLDTRSSNWEANTTDLRGDVK